MWYLIIAVLLGVIAWFFFQKKSEGGFNLVSKQEGRLRQGLEYLKNNETITNEQYREMVGVTARQAVRDLDVLEKKGIVEQVGKIGHTVKYKTRP